MSKFRVVKERQENGPEVVNDLRGLSKLGLLENEYPWVYLAVKSFEFGEIKKIAEKLGLKCKYNEEEKTTIIYDSTKNNDHKIKAVRLFGAALLITHIQQSASLMLGQIDTLRYKVLNLDLANFPETKTEEFQKWTSQAGITVVSSPLNVYLSQAGFNLAEVGDFLQLTSAEMQLLTQKITQSNSLKNAV